MSTPMNLFTPLLVLTVAGSGLLWAEDPFPTTEQLRPLEAAAAEAHPMPDALRLNLLDDLAADIVAPLRTPMRRLWLPENFTFDADAFRRAFEHDWNDRDDAPERMQELNVQFARMLDSLQKAQHEQETRLIEALARTPGVVAFENGLLCEPLPGVRAEENVSILRADSIEVCDLRGDVYYAAPVGEGDLIDIADLPSCIAESTDHLPAARTWVFIVPVSMLSRDECRNMPTESSRLVFILRHGEKDNANQGAWGRLAAAPNNGNSQSEANALRMPQRAAISQYAGHTIALMIKKSLYRASTESFPFDKAELEDALLRHLNAIASASPEHAQNGNTGREKTWEAYQAITEARQTAIERELLRLHAGLPGVHVEDSGLQYSVDKSDAPGENKPFAKANRATVARINGKKLFEQRMRPTDIPCLDELVTRIPDGRSWRFLIPASQIGDYKLLDDMGAGVTLTFTVSDAEEETENLNEEIAAASSGENEEQRGDSSGEEDTQAEN